MDINSINPKSKNKKIIYYSLIPLFFLSILGVYSFNLFSLTPISAGSSSTTSDGIHYKGSICVTVRDAEGNIKSNDCNHNTAMNIGLNKTRDILGLGATNAFNVIHLCNATAGCTTPAATDTAVQNTMGGCGLTAGAGTYSNLTGTGNWSIAKTFTSSCDNRLTNVTYITDSSNVPLAGANFSLVTLNNYDSITVNWTLTIS